MSKKYHVTWQTFFWLPLPFLALSILTILKLNDLERGVTKSEMLLEPLATVYEHFGYWPAVLIAPLGGLTFLTLATLVYFNERKDQKHSGPRMHRSG